MNTFKLALKNSSYLPMLFNSFNKNKTKNESFIRWFLISYFGASILLLLSLHSFCMGAV